MAATYRQSDVSSLLRLSGEIAELPCDLQSRPRASILGRLLELVGGCHAVCSEVDLVETLDRSPKRYPARSFMPATVRGASCRRSGSICIRDVPLDPASRICCAAPGGCRHHPPGGRDGPFMVPQRALQRDATPFRPRRIALCEIQTSGWAASANGFGAKVRDRPFTRREVQLVNVFHENLRHLYALPRQVVPEFNAVAMPQLPPRLQPVLNHLLGGDGEKQVAVKLGLSPHTVHEYVKAIYRRLGVSSRGELLARFVTV